MKKLIVLLLLFSYATLSEGFVSERIFFHLFRNLSEKDFHGVLFLFIYYLAQELIYWYEI